MEFQPSLRASDSDREAAAERLRHATLEGRLTGDELEERVEALFAARTYGDLDALVVDLPVMRSERRPNLRIRWWVGALGAVAVTLILVLIAALALAGRRSAAGVLADGRIRSFILPGPFADTHRGLFLATSAGAALVVLLASAATLWVLARSESTEAH